jgi:hypothetical protein
LPICAFSASRLKDDLEKRHLVRTVFNTMMNPTVNALDSAVALTYRSN